MYTVYILLKKILTKKLRIKKNRKEGIKARRLVQQKTPQSMQKSYWKYVVISHKFVYYTCYYKVNK